MEWYITLFADESAYNDKRQGLALPHTSLLNEEWEVRYDRASFERQYLTFIAHEDGCSFSFSTSGIECSVDDGETWRTLAANETVSANLGDRVMWKGMLSPTSSSGIGTFFSTKPFTVEGNVMSLLFGSDFVGKTSLDGKDYAFRSLFNNNSNLIHTRNLCLPAKTLANWCYYQMFQGCTSLTTTPQLPATTLASSCYSFMFNGCTSLTTAPQLLATTLASSCYQYMFNGCTSLTTAPELPATTLAVSCYSSMFKGCTSLTTAPELPATTLAENCYGNMFGGCTSLTTAPELLATTLANYCYQSMFYGCTSLTTAPQLPATTLAQYCYQQMFYGCTSLTTAPQLPATTLAYGCYANMFNGCTSLTRAPQLPATTLADYCYASMFQGCTSLRTAPPVLPATTLADYCYSRLFCACTNLVNGPKIYAFLGEGYSCSEMFHGCRLMERLDLLGDYNEINPSIFYNIDSTDPIHKIGPSIQNKKLVVKNQGFLEDCTFINQFKPIPSEGSWVAYLTDGTEETEIGLIVGCNDDGGYDYQY